MLWPGQRRRSVAIPQCNTNHLPHHKLLFLRDVPGIVAGGMATKVPNVCCRVGIDA